MVFFFRVKEQKRVEKCEIFERNSIHREKAAKRREKKRREKKSAETRPRKARCELGRYMNLQFPRKEFAFHCIKSNKKISIGGKKSRPGQARAVKRDVTNNNGRGGDAYLNSSLAYQTVQGLTR